jgi:large subunit ribosomal protein L17
MRHRVRKGKLGLKTEHRLALLRNLCTELFRHGRSTSTDVKVRELRRFSEKIITTAKTDSVHARRLVNTKIKDKEVLKKLFEEIAPAYSQRPGGYTRIVKLNFRRGDAAPVSLIELVGMQVPFVVKQAIDSPESKLEDKTDSKKVE